ncbi:hypothetical protein BE25_0238 [Staphylococcus phage vB_SepM_BE25]|nr:hypothetical protein BE25_0238 [Staphylococcus phage vB_SepM_BE25]
MYHSYIYLFIITFSINTNVPPTNTPIKKLIICTNSFLNKFNLLS